MGKVIPLFKTEPQPDERFELGDFISDEMAESLVETMGDISNLWQAGSEEDLRRQFQFVKDTVATWPGVV
jgi:hypothetical protein